MILRNIKNNEKMNITKSTDISLMPQYLKKDMKSNQNAILSEKEIINKMNYQRYLKELFELDERSPYTLIWDNTTKSYSKVLWKTIWEEREEREREEKETKWNNTLQKIENMLLDKLEREKPWLLEDMNNEQEKLKFVREYYS